MNNQFINDSNGITNLSNTFAINIPTAPQISEPKSYLVTFQQTDGTTHTLQLTDDELAALGLKSYFPSSNTVSPANSSCKPEQVKDPLIGQKEMCTDQRKPLGSSANPIQIIQSGQTLSTTQNVSDSHLKIIADILLSKEKQENKNESEDVVYRVVYPEELNLKPVLNKTKKCGRPRKKAAVTIYEQESAEVAEEPVPAKSARTRSGRIVRPPKHIEKDFKKIDISDKTENQDVLKTTEFSTPFENDIEQPKIFESLSHTPKKRIISSKYRCPKCQKVYLGRSRMVKHLEDNPDHGPIPEHCKTNNSEVWNYLVDITQKFPAGKRGIKFCEELTNLLQNLRVLSRFLFKLSDEKNTVTLDAVLGSALDLSPGNYRFNESELHKDVTIFKMLNDMKLFEDARKSTNNENKSSSVAITEQETNSENILPVTKNTTEAIPANFVNINTNLQDENAVMDTFSINDKKEPESSTANNNRNENSNSAISSHSELLSENSLISSLPNLRCSVDDLILPAMDTANVSQLLDSTTSSDEAINVDQLVNERLKSITGTDADLSNSAISLDLPTLDLFSFHQS